MNCPICESPAQPWGRVGETPILRCTAADCRFRFFDLDRWQSPYAQADYYADWNPGPVNPYLPWIQARVGIVRCLKPQGSVADLGSGVGETALALSEAGFSVVGVEESAKAVDFLKRNYPAVEWVNQGILDVLEDRPGSFDAITLFHVLEHIPRPADTIRLVDRALRSNGAIVIEVPDAGGGQARLMGERWDHYIPHHVNYFDLRSLARLMGTFGYRRRFLERTYHFSHPQGDALKDVVKGTLARIGLNAIIRTGWMK